MRRRGIVRIITMSLPISFRAIIFRQISALEKPSDDPVHCVNLRSCTTQRREHHSQSLSPHGFHRVVYYEWGDPRNPRVVDLRARRRAQRRATSTCWPRRSRRRIACLPSTCPGAARATGSPIPTTTSSRPTSPTLTALIARSGAETVDWVGTSMGGLLGMTMAAQPQSPVARLVVNDVGPAIEPAALERIARLLRHRPDVRDLRRDRGLHPRDVGAVRTAHRRAVGAPHAHQRPPARRRPLGPRLRPGHRGAVPRGGGAARTCGRCGTRSAARRCVLRGAQSDLLSAATAAADDARADRKPAVVEFAGVGHAPMLLTPRTGRAGRCASCAPLSAALAPVVPAARSAAGSGSRWPPWPRWRCSSAVGNVARAAAARRLVARAEGAAAGAAVAGSCARRRRRGSGSRCCCRSISPRRSCAR